MFSDLSNNSTSQVTKKKTKINCILTVMKNQLFKTEITTKTVKAVISKCAGDVSIFKCPNSNINHQFIPQEIFLLKNSRVSDFVKFPIKELM